MTILGFGLSNGSRGLSPPLLVPVVALGLFARAGEKRSWNCAWYQNGP
jgi:hypothetical protein